MPATPRLLHLDRATDVRMTPGSRTITAVRREPNGSQLFLESHVQQNGLRRMTAYRVTRNASAGTMSRLYMDGRKVVVGRDFVLRSQPRHLTVVAHGNGLREATLPNGKPVYRDRFATADARGRPTLVRTVYARVHDGKVWAIRHPVAQVFHLVPFHGADLYVYQPWAPPVAFYQPFVAVMPAPLPPSIGCPACMDSGEVAFADAPEPYTDPGAMLADNVIAGGIHDGVNGSQDDVSPPDAEDDANVPPVALGNSDPDPELAKMAVDSGQLEMQLASTQAQDADLGGSASAQKLPPQSDAQRPGPVRVSSDVRDQVRKQVKYDVSLQKAGQPLSLENVLQSKNPANYVFQVNDMISAADVNAGDECVLSTGDLIRFDQIPGESDPVARMRVITAKDGSCQAGAVVQIGLSDVQNMLNGFSQRLEMAMRDTHDKVAATAPHSGIKG